MDPKTNYKIKRKIGVGGMATVYLAQDVALNRDVAIKVLQIDPGLKLSKEARNQKVLRWKLQITISSGSISSFSEAASLKRNAAE